MWKTADRVISITQKVQPVLTQILGVLLAIDQLAREAVEEKAPSLVPLFKKTGPRLAIVYLVILFLCWFLAKVALAAISERAWSQFYKNDPVRVQSVFSKADPTAAIEHDLAPLGLENAKTFAKYIAHHRRP